MNFHRKQIYQRLGVALLLFCSFLLINPASVSAHFGNTDSSGGHTCRTNCSKYGLEYGEYHTHDAKESEGFNWEAFSAIIALIGLVITIAEILRRKTQKNRKRKK